MLILIFITTIVSKVIVCDEDSNESRYIDLLPEEEKEQFLERIARRIVEDANVKDDNNNKNKHSTEITDDQLNEHNEYVQKLLEEESENLRKNNINDTTKAENGESESVKSVDKAKHDLEDEKNIALTVRKKRRDSFDTVNTDNDTYIKVDVEYDKKNLDNDNKYMENPLPLTLNENNESKTEKSIENAADKSDVEDIQVKNIRRNYPQENINIKEVEVISNKDLDVTTLDAKISDYITEEVTTTKQSKDIMDGDLKLITENLPKELPINHSEIFYDKSTMRSEPVKNFNDSHINKYTKRGTVTDVPTMEFTTTNLGTTTISNDDTEVNGSMILKTGIHNQEVSSYRDGQKMKKSVNIDNDNVIMKLQLTTKNVLYENLKVTNNNTSCNKINNINFNSTNQYIVNVKNLDPESTFRKERINTVVGARKEIENGIKEEIINLTSTYDSKDDMAKDFLKALRSNLLQANVSNDNSQIDTNKQMSTEHNPKYALKSKITEYNVYEIPEGKPVFTIQSKSQNRQNKEQPYYVPVYNYSPNNAYFNAQNRYGPNYDDKKLEDDNSYITGRKEIYNHRSLNYYNQRKFNFVKRIDRNTKSTNIKTSRHISRFPSEKKIVPENYTNAAYYLGSKDVPYLMTQFKDKYKRKLPASDEETHPFSNLNNVKSHIQAIRHILFEQKRFGYVKQVNSSEIRSVHSDDYNETTTLLPTFKLKSERTNLDNSEESSISVHYYSGRLKSDASSDEDKLSKKIGYINYSDGIKYIYLSPNAYKNNRTKIKASNTINNHFKKDLRIKTLPSSKALKQSEFYDPLKAIIDMRDEKDLLQISEKLKVSNMTGTRSYDSSTVLDAYVEVMRDMVHLNSRALNQYDWLGTTVDIRAAIKKLHDLINSLRNFEKIHPSDLQLLKYVTFLCLESKRLLQTEANMKNPNYELRNKLLPSIKKKRKYYLKDKGLINRVWLLRREGVFDFTTRELFIFNDFLYDLQNALYELHEAIKHIASVTTVRNQRWFENIKELYLNDKRKQLLEIVLHLSAARLFDMIEEKSVDIETNLEVFSKENKEVIRESIEEFKFVLTILKEIISLN